jgi:hypothetical protein
MVRAAAFEPHTTFTDKQRPGQPPDLAEWRVGFVALGAESGHITVDPVTAQRLAWPWQLLSPHDSAPFFKFRPV